jgi:hypothetical protein
VDARVSSLSLLKCPDLPEIPGKIKALEEYAFSDDFCGICDTTKIGSVALRCGGWQATPAA